MPSYVVSYTVIPILLQQVILGKVHSLNLQVNKAASNAIYFLCGGIGNEF
jgi:hypothetical protein